jgi:hypothetical protein
MAITGYEYANLIADYLHSNFSDRGIQIYREVSIGKSIIGKNRRVDMLLISDQTPKAFAIECKFQDSSGTADEKIPYAMQNMKALPMGGCIVYAGGGFSVGVLHMLQASEIAAYCLPDMFDVGRSTKDTKELDHLLAMHFHWWDILIAGKKPWTARPTVPRPIASLPIESRLLPEASQTERLGLSNE